MSISGAGQVLGNLVFESAWPSAARRCMQYLWYYQIVCFFVNVSLIIIGLTITSEFRWMDGRMERDGCRGWMVRDGWRMMDGWIEGWIVNHEDSAIFNILNVILIRFVLNCIADRSLPCICNSLVLYCECFQCISVCFRAGFKRIIKRIRQVTSWCFSHILNP